jgi:hypothetical protein
LRTFRKCGGFADSIFFCGFVICNLWICGLQTQALLKLPKVTKYLLFLLTNIAFTALI